MKLRVDDLDALEDAAAVLGLELRRNQKTYKWYGQWMNDFHGSRAAVSNGYDPKAFGQCAHAIGIAGDRQSYEIGLVPTQDGQGFDLLYDSWDGKIEPSAGKGLSRLRQEYAAAKALKQAKKDLVKKGFTAKRELLEGGRILLRLRRR